MKTFNRFTRNILLVGSLITTVSACGPQLTGSPSDSEALPIAPQTPERPARKVRQSGPFSLHSEEFACGSPLGDVFSCVRQGCFDVGGLFDEASKECFCDRGNFRMLGRVATCEMPTFTNNVIRNNRGSEYMSIRNTESMGQPPFPFLQQDAELVSLSLVRSTRLHFGPLSDANVSEYGFGTVDIFSRPSDLADTYEHSSQIDFRADGLVTRFYAQQTLHLAKDQWSASSLMRGPRGEQRFARASAPKDRQGPSILAEEILSSLQSLNAQRTLPTPTIVFSSRSGGCAAGCELDYVLQDWAPSSLAGYDARFVYKKEYLWGAFSGERLEIEARPTNDPTRINRGAIVTFLPNGEVSTVAVQQPVFGNYDFGRWEYFDHWGVNLREAE